MPMWNMQGSSMDYKFVLATPAVSHMSSLDGFRDGK